MKIILGVIQIELPWQRSALSECSCSICCLCMPQVSNAVNTSLLATMECVSQVTMCVMAMMTAPTQKMKKTAVCVILGPYTQKG